MLRVMPSDQAKSKNFVSTLEFSVFTGLTHNVRNWTHWLFLLDWKILITERTLPIHLQNSRCIVYSTIFITIETPKDLLKNEFAPGHVRNRTQHLTRISAEFMSTQGALEREHE